MSIDSFQIVLCNGFDRSGTSAISRTLAVHPGIELLMQPFNSGPLRQVMYSVLDDHLLSDSDWQFFDKLTHGTLDVSYIQSEWFFKHSTTQAIVPNTVHLIKTTISHFMVPWIRQRFPSIQVWGIWREPIDVLKSIFRNGFENWYANSLEPIRHTIRTQPLLDQLLGRYIRQPLEHVVDQVALNFAARSIHFFSHIPANQILVFESFCQDANSALSPFLQAFNLPSFDFSSHAIQDHNIVGQRVTQPHLRDPFANLSMDSAISILDTANQFVMRKLADSSIHSRPKFDA